MIRRSHLRKSGSFALILKHLLCASCLTARRETHFFGLVLAICGYPPQRSGLNYSFALMIHFVIFYLLDVIIMELLSLFVVMLLLCLPAASADRPVYRDCLPLRSELLILLLILDLSPPFGCQSPPRLLFRLMAQLSYRLRLPGTSEMFDQTSSLRPCPDCFVSGDCDQSTCLNPLFALPDLIPGIFGLDCDVVPGCSSLGSWVRIQARSGSSLFCLLLRFSYPKAHYLSRSFILFQVD